jgi:hypothetical protein
LHRYNAEADELARRHAGLVEAERRCDAIDGLRVDIILGNMRAARELKRAAVVGARAGRRALVAAAEALAEEALAAAGAGAGAGGSGAEAEEKGGVGSGAGAGAGAAPLLTRELTSFLHGCISSGGGGGGGGGGARLLPSPSRSLSSFDESSTSSTWMSAAMEPLGVRGPPGGGAGAVAGQTAAALRAVAAAAALRDELRLAVTHTRGAIASLVDDAAGAPLGTRALSDVIVALAERRGRAADGALPRLAEGAGEAAAGLEACGRLDAASEAWWSQPAYEEAAPWLTLEGRSAAEWRGEVARLDAMLK